MGPIGIPELLFILVLALLIFGPRKLPQIGRTLGRAMGEFRRATTDLKRTLNTEMSLEETRSEKELRPGAPATPAAKPTAPEPQSEAAAAGGEKNDTDAHQEEAAPAEPQDADSDTEAQKKPDTGAAAG